MAFSGIDFGECMDSGYSRFFCINIVGDA